MNKHEEIYFISKLICSAKEDGEVELNSSQNWENLYLHPSTKITEDYLYDLASKNVLHYEEIGDEGFKPIVICFVNQETTEYLKNLLIGIESELLAYKNEVEGLNKRIAEILTFDPEKLSNEIQTSEKVISTTKDQLRANPILHPLILQLEQIELHFKSISKVARNYEDVYKNIILPVKEEGKSGVRKTVQWAIISIILSTLLSLLASWLIKL